MAFGRGRSAPAAIAGVATCAATAAIQAVCLDRYLLLANASSPDDVSRNFGDGLSLGGMLFWLVTLAIVSVIGAAQAMRVAELPQYFGVSVLLLALEGLISGILWVALPGQSHLRSLITVPVLVVLAAIAVAVVPRRTRQRPSIASRNPRRKSVDSRRRGVV